MSTLISMSMKARVKARGRKPLVCETLERRELLAGDLYFPETFSEATEATIEVERVSSGPIASSNAIYGDVNADGVFDNTDLAEIYQAAQFEDGIPGNSIWATGDFNGDGDFTTSDLVYVFQRFGTSVPLAAHGGEHSFTTPLRVMTYNAQMFPQGLDRLVFWEDLNGRCCIDHRSEQIAQEVLDKNLDLVGFQEVFDHKLIDGQEGELTDPILEGWFGPDWKDFEKQHRVFGPDEDGLELSSGLVLVSRYPIVGTTRTVFSDASGADRHAQKGILHARIRRSPTDDVHVYVTHLQAADETVRRRQFVQLADFIGRTARPGNPVMVLGDMNTNGRLDTRGTDYDALLANLRSFRPNTVDVWDQLRPTGRGGTSEQTSTEIGSRIDYIFYSDALNGETGEFVPIEISVDPMPDPVSTYLSDHSAVEARFDWEIDALPSVEVENLATGLKYTYRDDYDPKQVDHIRYPIHTPKYVDVISSGAFLDINNGNVAKKSAVSYEGYLDVPQTGEYEFRLSSDDGSRLVILDSETGNMEDIVINDGQHGSEEKIGYATLEAGLHFVRVDYFQHKGGKSLSLAWSGPGFSRSALTPSSFLAPLLAPVAPTGATEQGLEYSYYHRRGGSIPNFDYLTPVQTGRILGNIYLGNRLRDSDFGFRFEGYILAPQDGLYTFETRSDDGSRLFIGSQYLVNNDGDHSPRTRRGRIFLQSGYHPIRIEYIENSGSELLEVNWEGPGVGGLRGIESSVFTFSDPVGFDYHDAPPQYSTGSILADSAHHGVVPNFSLGSSVDSETRPQVSLEANGDDLDSADDEDGVLNTNFGQLTITGGLRRGTNNSLRVNVTNGASIANPYLDAWIDFNRDGDWNDESERIVSQPVVAGNNTVTFTLPQTAELGETFARFRLHSATGPGLRPGGGASLGEVEDHRVIIRADFSQTLDLGEIRASDADTSDRFGHAVAISGDTMVVGANLEDPDGGIDTGAAYVYVRRFGQWQEQAKLTASDQDDIDLFGQSVAISGDTIVVGSTGDDDHGQDSGSAHVFVRVGSSWVEQAKLTASDAGAGDTFGAAVAIDQNTIVVGSPRDDNQGADAGSVYVFSRAGSTWIEQAHLIPNDATPETWFGFSVSVSGDTLAVGAPLHNGVQIDTGAAYLYTRDNGSWTLQSQITHAAGVRDDLLGYAVSIHADTLAVGAYNVDGVGLNEGAAFVYARNGTTWFQQAELRPTDLAEGDNFGFSVSVSGDGLIAGARFQDGADQRSGAAYIFRRDGSNWSQHSKRDLADGRADERFGHAVAISGSIAAVGANLRSHGDTLGDAQRGSVYTYGVDSSNYIGQLRLADSLLNVEEIRGPFFNTTPFSVSQNTVTHDAGRSVQFGFELRPLSTEFASPVTVQDSNGTRIEPVSQVRGTEADPSSLAIAELPDDLYNVVLPSEQGDLRVFLIGDFNDDQSVDAADGLMIREKLGSVAGDENYDVNLDVNRDQRIDVEDYSMWRHNLGVQIIDKAIGPACIEVDTQIDTSQVEVSPIDGSPRPIAAIVDENNLPAYFIENELLLQTDDEGAIADLLQRLGGSLVGQFNSLEFGDEIRDIYRIRVDPSAFDDSTLERDLYELQPGNEEHFTVSSQNARRLLAKAASEARNGIQIGVNWVARSSMFRDGATVEGFSTYGRDAFAWPHTSVDSIQDIGVAEAWRAMELAGVLDNQVDIGIIDRGFTVTGDFPDYSAVLLESGASPIGLDGWNSHGTRVTEAAMGRADNGIGAAGPAGPVGRAVVGYLGADIFSAAESVVQVHSAGARIINMSFGYYAPWLLSWTTAPFDNVVRAVQDAGTLIFAAAGNDGIDVDSTIGFAGGLERIKNVPCEIDGVICVGGLAENSTSRAANSNFGREDVDIFAPYVVLTTSPPTAVALNAGQQFGTSFSSPFVAGVAALIWASNPSQTANQVSDVLFETAHSSPDPDVGSYVNALDAVLNVLGDIRPFVEITSPIDGQSYSSGSDFTLTAHVEDYEDGTGLPITWTSHLDGVIGVDVASADLSPGSHLISASVTDSAGQTASDFVAINITDEIPAANIITPDMASVEFFFDGFDTQVGQWYTDLTLSGQATDAEDGSLVGNDLIWVTSRSDLQPLFLGNGETITVRLYGSSSCFGATHQITFVAQDSDGNIGSDLVEIRLYTLC